VVEVVESPSVVPVSAKNASSRSARRSLRCTSVMPADAAMLFSVAAQVSSADT
jgi:hypothetical protein